MNFSVITKKIPYGALALALAIVIQRFLPANGLFDFLAGFLLGLSLVLNISYILNLRKLRMAKE